MIRISRLLMTLALVVVLLAPFVQAAVSLASSAPAFSPLPAALFKDGEDDDGSDSSDDSSEHDSSDDGEADDSGGDDGDDSSGSGGGSDDEAESDDSGGGDEVEGEGESSSGHGNDDFLESDGFAGETIDEVDDDGDEATDGYRAGQVIVHLQPRAVIDDVNLRHGTATAAGVLSANLFLLTLPEGVDASAALSALATDPDVRWVELNYLSQAPEGRPGYFFVSGETMDAPGESYAPELLGYGLPAAACATGQGVTVAVLDTGIDAAHPAFSGRAIAPGWSALTNTADVTDAGNGQDDDGDGLVDEMVGHGTHVSGIIAQVAPGATILPVKVLGSDGVGDAFDVAAGIYYALDQGADVINLSLSSTYDARVVAEAVAVANERGVVVVAAAGNAGTDRVLEFPAADTGVVAVAATDASDRMTEFTNFGEQIDLAAPGDAIVSALPGGTYAAWSGTSMAAPFVAAAAALLAESEPDWFSTDITRRLTETATSLEAADAQIGAGRLDVAAALGCSDSPAQG